MPRGALKLTYKVEDDYGVVSADARITPRAAESRRPDRLGAHPKPRRGRGRR